MNVYLAVIRCAAGHILFGGAKAFSSDEQALMLRDEAVAEFREAVTAGKIGRICERCGSGALHVELSRTLLHSIEDVEPGMFGALGLLAVRRARKAVLN